MVKKIGRREFVKKTAQVGFSAVIGGSVLSHFSCSQAAACDVAVVSGPDYLSSTGKAVELLGGMENFVKKGSRVAILPNTQSRHPGTYTKPDIVRSVIRMCKEAGAAEVNCLSWLTPKHWEDSGLDKAVKEEGANLKLIDRVPATIDKKKFIPFTNSQTRNNCKVPDFPTFGTGYRTYVTGLTHNEKGFPATDKQPDHERLVKRITEKISDDADKLVMVEKIKLDDADTVFVTYGATARPAESAMEMARKEGKKVGLLRLKLVWPFPEKVIEKLAKNVDKIIVPEMNLGQMVHPVREIACKHCEVVSAPKIGGEMHLPMELYKYLEGK